jgi:2-oxo-4-hydroxy-4-carboxy-5-ureidoimidazoline decarboxylase
MIMTIAEFDHLDAEAKKKLLQPCCGSSAWVQKMLSSPPAEDLVDLLEMAEENWYACNENDWREAFAQHPMIGDLASLKEKYATTANWAASEQSGVQAATEQTLMELAALNKAYKEKFGYIFIVFATGKSAEDMLQLLKERINNDPALEVNIAMEEQHKITKLRLEKLFES